MRIRDLNTKACQDICANVKTDRLVEGAPVYRCPGCDQEWIYLDDRTPELATDEPVATQVPVPDAVSAVGLGAASASENDVSTLPAAGEFVHPELLQTVLDARDIRALAEFYKAFLGLQYRPGDAPPFVGTDDADWLVLTHHDGRRALAFQLNEQHVPPTWPKSGVPQQLHLDLTVPDAPALAAARDRAVALGARLLLDRSGDPAEPLYVFADPAGHPFCVFVG